MSNDALSAVTEGGKGRLSDEKRTLLGGILHSLNNKLAVASANAEILLDENLTEGQKVLATEVHTSLAQITALVEKLAELKNDPPEAKQT